ncbi:MAG: zinc-binding dehydrogenase [Gaiellaceae bacterium]
MLAAAFWDYGGPEAIRWGEVPEPALAATDVLIEVKACGVNHSDLDSRAGTSRWSFAFPWVLGAEFAGLVAEVGSEVDGIEAGQPVTALQQYACGQCEACIRWRPDLCPRFTVFGTDCWGGYAELVRAPARAVLALESPDQFVSAAASQCVVSTAWSMVVSLAEVHPGETVLVPSASGGVAGAAVQCAKIAGANVVASVGSPEKIGRVEELGADVAFCYRDWPVREAVAELTDGRGVDVVVDTVGGPHFTDHLSALRPDGRLVTCGAHAGEVVPLDIVELFRRGHRILGFRLATPDEFREALRLVFAGRIRVPIDRTFEMSVAREAHAYLDERRHVGKIVLVRS